MYEAKVTINLKEGVSDPEGENTLKALRLLGFDNVQQAKIIRIIDIIINGANEEEVQKNVEQMCKRLLINPVIHKYNIEIFEKK